MDNTFRQRILIYPCVTCTLFVFDNPPKAVFLNLRFQLCSEVLPRSLNILEQPATWRSVVVLDTSPSYHQCNCTFCYVASFICIGLFHFERNLISVQAFSLPNNKAQSCLFTSLSAPCPFSCSVPTIFSTCVQSRSCYNTKYLLFIFYSTTSLTFSLGVSEFAILLLLFPNL